MQFQSLHYKPRKISQIRENDSRIALLGKVLEKRENSFLISDESGEIEIFSDKPPEKGSLVRVFCSRQDDKLATDVIQDLRAMDLNLYSKINELYNRAENV